jgi:hypothetical protein
MSVRTALCALLLALVAGPAGATGAGGEPTKEWRFRVLLDDDEIGYHHFRVTEQSGRYVVDSEAKFRVRILFFDAYRYEHVNRERWSDQCLVDIDARTEVNGELLAVSGSRQDGGFTVETSAGDLKIDDCVMTFAYWNPEFLEQTRLLNSQTGDYVDVSIRPAGEEALTVRGENVRAERFELAADKLNMELWYSSDREWLGLESVTKGGRKLRYVLL